MPGRFEKNNFVRLTIPLFDGEASSEAMPAAIDQGVEFINEAVKKAVPVLVHCGAGMSRSPTIVAAYLMRTNRWRMKTAFEHIWQHRRLVLPNRFFLRSLRKEELRLFGDSARCAEILIDRYETVNDAFLQSMENSTPDFEHAIKTVLEQ